MVIKRLRDIVFIWLMIWAVFTSGQDVSFSQFYANPLYLNPAFAGSAGVPRIALQYRNQWHKFDNPFLTYSVGLDIPVKKLQGGIGLNIINDSQADNILNSIQINLAYSVYVQLSEKFRLHGGLQAGFNQNSLQVDKLIFPDNLDPNFGDHGITQEVISDPNYSFIDFSTGVLVYSKRLFFGAAVHHLTEPKQSYFSGAESVGKLYRKYTLHVGAKLPVYRQGHLRKKFDISPQLIVQQQGTFQQINYGIFATKYGLTGGAWFRQNFGLRYDAVIFLVGFVKKNIQFTYSYDWTVSGLWGDSGGTSEVLLVFLLKDTKERRNLPFFNQYEERFGVQ